MRVLVGVLVLSLCAFATHTRVQDWRSDQALFTAAVRVTPAYPRPMLNLAVAYGRAGRWAEACAWTRRATQRLAVRPDAALQRIAAAQVTWIDIFSGSCSDSPS